MAPPAVGSGAALRCTAQLSLTIAIRRSLLHDLSIRVSEDGPAAVCSRHASAHRLVLSSRFQVGTPVRRCRENLSLSSKPRPPAADRTAPHCSASVTASAVFGFVCRRPSTDFRTVRPRRSAHPSASPRTQVAIPALSTAAVRRIGAASSAKSKRRSIPAVSRKYSPGHSA